MTLIMSPEGEAPVKIGTNVKKHFGTFNCRQATYKCRIQKQYLQLKRKALKVNAIYRSTHQKFLRAIDHMNSTQLWVDPRQVHRLDSREDPKEIKEQKLEPMQVK